MPKLIAAMNMTLDGFCDHTSMMADDEIHDHYTELLNNAGAILYGRITYQLMEYWPTVLKNHTGKKSDYDFAVAIDRVPKIVFSNTLKNVEPIGTDPIGVGWATARLATKSIEEEVSALKQSGIGGKDIFVGSPGLIVSCTNLNLIDEFQISVHPVIVGKGLSLFKNITDRVNLKLVKTKTFTCGAVTFYYETVRN